MRPSFALTDRVAVVTGASSGIGQPMARILALAGARVVAIARRADRLEDTVATIRADVGDHHRLDAVAARAAEPFGAPDIVVNAAGVNLREPWDAITPESWDRTLDLDLAAPFFLARALAPAMLERGWGRVINIASLQSQRAMPNSIPYGAAKGGIAQLTRAMAEAWSARGVMCNAIAPGYFPTELTAPVFGDPARAEALARQTAIGRNGRFEDLAGPLVFLASPASDYVTGQVLYVDGGFTAK